MVQKMVQKNGPRNGPKNSPVHILPCAPLMISLKYITSLAFSQLCGAGGGYKKTPLCIPLQANIIGEKKNKQNEFCCAV